MRYDEAEPPMRKQLAGTMGRVFFSDLRAHVARGVVVVVDGSIDLLDVAEALATNDTVRVDAWIGRNLLTKPTLEQLDRWSRIADARWDSLVVAPFVLIWEHPPPN
jgi:hypothetical protein